jgi:Lrp/AsnC family leucine-responsive transcriptional regulator
MANVGYGCAVDALPTTDSIDEAMIELLQEDGRRSVASMAKIVNLSTSAVKRRLDRLERDRIITGYTALVDRYRHGRQLEALTELRFNGKTNLDQIRTAVMSLQQVQAVFTTAWDPDAVVWLRVEDRDGLRQAIDGIRRNVEVTGTKTLLILESWWRDPRDAG